MFSLPESMGKVKDLPQHYDTDTEGGIKAAVKAGSTTFETVQEATGACTHCGGCLDKVAEQVEQFTK